MRYFAAALVGLMLTGCAGMKNSPKAEYQPVISFTGTVFNSGDAIKLPKFAIPEGVVENIGYFGIPLVSTYVHAQKVGKDCVVSPGDPVSPPNPLVVSVKVVCANGLSESGTITLVPVPAGP